MTQPSSSAASDSNGPTAPAQALPSQLLHDLRTPVHQIVGYVEMLQEDATDAQNETLANDLGKVKNAAAQLQKMLDERFVATRDNGRDGDGDNGRDGDGDNGRDGDGDNGRDGDGDNGRDGDGDNGRDGDGDNGRDGDAPAAVKPVEAAPIVASHIASAAASAEDDTSLSSGAERGLLLVVDDNETNRDVLSRRLQMQGYAVETAPDGLTALSVVEARVFDLVLLDIMMPDMDGYEVLRRLKADDKTRDLPVIMISAIGDIDSVVRCIELGAEDYLPKPFNPTLLKARIGACLEKKRGHDREVRLFAQLQENYQRLQEMEKMRDDLTNMIVHDLRTPLSSLMAGLQTIPMLGEMTPDQKECCDIALRGGFSLLDMINDLLDISKLEGGAPDLDIETLEVPELVESAFQQVQSAAAQREIQLERDFAFNLPTLQGDESKLRRTLVNLLGNAIKFSQSGSAVCVGAQHDETEMRLWVRDHGEGIPRDAFERIFEKFGQVEDRKAGRTMSTGLGLALCKMVVEAHEGRIWVESELGKGSTFYIALPL